MSHSDFKRQRVTIEGVFPEIDGGRYPIKRVPGERVAVCADLLADGHDAVTARVLFRQEKDSGWAFSPMRLLGNDRWEGLFCVKGPGVYFYTIEAWIDTFKTWRQDMQKRLAANQALKVDLLIGAALVQEASKRASGADAKKLFDSAQFLSKAKSVERALAVALEEGLSGLMEKYPDLLYATRYPKELAVTVDRDRALFSTWYERFPRSCATAPGGHGTLADCERLLPEIAHMGFDVFYLPPIHPIGKAHRKGKNNSPLAGLDDPGSPWAIGSKEGGHKAIHPQLGKLADFDRLLRKAKAQGIEIAMDLAFQCSPDHPYVKQHPQWFKWRPDGTVQYAENPPKKYEDILPLNFESDDWEALWEELKSVVEFWAKRGVKIFRVDNPHTKPFAFWEWLIAEVKKTFPETIFLAEAFTRPKVMQHLAKLGFTQSYTYFTWRVTKHELTDYLTELTQSPMAEYFRPNFWPNTPDILPEHLQFWGRPAFITRLVLAATLSSNYGIYGPAFELGLHEAREGVEEYVDSEKYEIKHWDWDQPGNIKELISRVNRIRRENPALQTTRNLTFCELQNDNLLAYIKSTEDASNILLIVVNLDPHHSQSGWVKVPLYDLGLDLNQSYLMHDLLSEDRYIWQGEWNFVALNPHVAPAHILHLRSRLKREADFDYFM